MEIREDTQDGNVQHISPYISEVSEGDDELSEGDDELSKGYDEFNDSEIIGDGISIFI